MFSEILSYITNFFANGTAEEKKDCGLNPQSLFSFRQFRPIFTYFTVYLSDHTLKQLPPTNSRSSEFFGRFSLPNPRK